MTKDGNNARKQAARQLAKSERIPYTEALRRLERRSASAEFPHHPPATPYEPTTVRVGPPVPTLKAQTTLRGHTNGVRGAFLCPDGRTLVSGGDITARIWDVESEETTLCLYQSAGVAALALSPDGSTVAVAGHDGSVLLWNPASGETRGLAEGGGGGEGPGSVEWMSFPDADAHILAAGRVVRRHEPMAGPPRPHGGVQRWDLRSDTATLFDPPSGRVFAVAPEQGSLVVGTQEGVVRLYTATGEPYAELAGHDSMIDSATISPDGRLLAAGAASCTVRLWDLATRDLIGVIEPHGGYITAVAFSPDSRVLATGTRDGVTRCWDAETGQQTANLLGHGDLISSLSFSADGRTLVTASMDATIRLWAGVEAPDRAEPRASLLEATDRRTVRAPD